MTRSYRESQGSDLFRGDMKCHDFHDHLGRKSTYWGGTYNCCCCDPCRFITPGPQDHQMDMRYFTCKCVPRGFLLKFVPSGSGACCRETVVPMMAQFVDVDSYYTTYSATLYGVEVTVNIGNVIGSGESQDNQCGWEIISTILGSGSGSGSSQTIEVDHDTNTCLYVPTGINLPEVEGPDGCMGTLQLEDLAKVRLPFQERTEVIGYGPKFVDISDDPCGTCTSVCTKICATGYRHATGDSEHVEFTWFDDVPGSGVGSGSGATDRGWYYDNPNTGKTEYLFLGHNDDGTCVITPNLEDGAEIFDPVTVDSTRLCSCNLKETFTYSGDLTRPFTIRCGFCGQWDFLCGTCRCAPATLCVTVFDGETLYTNLEATWEEDLKAWVIEQGSGSGSVGSGEYFLRLALIDENGACVVAPYLNGELIDCTKPTFDCGDETIYPFKFTGEHDFLSFQIDGTINGSGSGDTYVFLVASSLSSECGTVSPCSEATPCASNCGSHPAMLTVNIRQWQDQDDISGEQDPLPDANIDVNIYYWQTVGLEAGDIRIRCGYVGAGPLCGDGYRVYVTLNNGQVQILAKPVTVPAAGWGATYTLDTETCDPYYGYHYEGPPAAGPLPESCIGASDQTTRAEITITE